MSDVSQRWLNLAMTDLVVTHTGQLSVSARDAYEVGMLSAIESLSALYSARFWHPFRRMTWADTT